MCGRHLHSSVAGQIKEAACNALTARVWPGVRAAPPSVRAGTAPLIMKMPPACHGERGHTHAHTRLSKLLRMRPQKIRVCVLASACVCVCSTGGAVANDIYVPCCRALNAMWATPQKPRQTLGCRRSSKGEGFSPHLFNLHRPGTGRRCIRARMCATLRLCKHGQALRSARIVAGAANGCCATPLRQRVAAHDDCQAGLCGRR